ncbi:P-loop NTPase fold protein [Pseudomonas sp.]|uniref:P-loop NTPase fold protein n=1 Tax=Pseudomonas sp. TaxID=306 RepID=UPI001A006801|nr:P-loop NTPase fold protein [Pseudomonas sp.]MBF0675514.1 hypothetical protein [Pseudomonas sp.]
MLKNEASQFLNYYLDENIDTEYAVMLDGPWGAGKTHFIKKYLRDRAIRLAITDKPSYLYASLYGINSTSEITDQFFTQAHPILNSKASRIFGIIASKALNGLVGTEVNSAGENNSVIQDMVMKLDGKVLVFDDLERSSMSISDVMGFINTYVEHEGLKVIMLANETDIPKDQLATYNRQKEKLVGKTIQVQSDPIEVIEKLIERMRLDSVKQTITREKSALLSTFLASKKTNYRNLRVILSEYERLVDNVDSRLQDSPEAMKQLLLYMVATGHEYRSGELDVQIMEALPTSQYYWNQGEIKTPAVQAFEQLKHKYTDVKWVDPIIAPAQLANLYKAGLIDAESINNALSEHPAVVGHAVIPPWRLLWSWADLPRTDYLKARRKLLVQLCNYEINHPGMILHVAGTILLLKRFGDALLGDEVDVIEFFDGYLKELLKIGSLTPDLTTFGFLSTAYAGLGYASHDTEDFKEIYTLVKEATELMCANKMKEISAHYIQRLASNSDAYSSLYEYGMQEDNYAEVAFLHYLDATDFARLLIVDSAPNDKLFASLANRYAGERSFRLREEHEWLAKLKVELVNILNRAAAPYRQLLTLRVGYYFELIEKSIAPGN